ncbi:uncharacterized protein MCYG_06490 [Microsporum canis CBS 113480]|uniref:Uncharacterized protein n=1 Tax=Arthroderma otae (strain ATCC MYA-4605 / CBS 113480) TaxID=554155 RepID=C5FUT7_ARTOC|nr:uncharacterized protein MCYG_06490 [Microsporum canis CBS 113480]EEQ33671.1 predicted protein [Microsporum canis CBS 113480]
MDLRVEMIEGDCAPTALTREMWVQMRHKLQDIYLIVLKKRMTRLRQRTPFKAVCTHVPLTFPRAWLSIVMDGQTGPLFSSTALFSSVYGDILRVEKSTPGTNHSVSSTSFHPSGGLGPATTGSLRLTAPHLRHTPPESSI